MAEGFGDRLARRIANTSPLCVGLDPSPGLLAHWGLEDSPQGLESMSFSLLDVVADSAAALKPQVAYFERHGAAGYAVLERVMSRANEKGLLVVADAKRGDIDATMAAYGQAWLRDESPLVADAVTVTAYLGLGAMEELFELAESTGRGVFCVVASSNPEGRSLQEASVAGKQSVEAMLLEQLGGRNRALQTKGAAVGSFGAVVGATRSAGSLDLASLCGPFLVPGVGAQGATPSEVGVLFSGVMAHTVLVNASRSILRAGPDPESVAKEVGSLATELRSALG